MNGVQLGALIMLLSAVTVGGLIVAVGVYVTIAAALCVAIVLAIVGVELLAWAVADALGRAIAGLRR